MAETDGTFNFAGSTGSPFEGKWRRDGGAVLYRFSGNTWLSALNGCVVYVGNFTYTGNGSGTIRFFITESLNEADNTWVRESPPLDIGEAAWALRGDSLTIGQRNYTRVRADAFGHIYHGSLKFDFRASGTNIII